LHAPLPEAIAGHDVIMPEVIARDVRLITDIRLLRPDGVKAREETAGMIENRVKIDLVQVSGDVLVQAGRVGQIHGQSPEMRVEIRMRHLVTDTHGPFVEEKLIEGDD